MIPTGIGVGLTFPTLMGVSAAGLPPSAFATGSGVINMIRQAALAVGVAIFVAIIGSPSSLAGTRRRVSSRMVDHGRDRRAGADSELYFYSGKAEVGGLPAAVIARSAATNAIQCAIVWLLDCFAPLAMTNDAPSKHLEIFALLPVRHFGLEALDLGVLDVDVIIDELGAERLAEEWIFFQRDDGFPERLRQ